MEYSFCLLCSFIKAGHIKEGNIGPALIKEDKEANVWKLNQDHPSPVLYPISFSVHPRPILKD